MWPGGGQNGQTCLNFIMGDPVGSIRKEKNTNQSRWQVIHVAGHFFCWDILVSPGYEVGGGKSVKNVRRASKCRPRLSLQTAASDRVKGLNDKRAEFGLVR